MYVITHIYNGIPYAIEIYNKGVYMKTFALEQEPIDYQISIHLNNMFNTYSKEEVMFTYWEIQRDNKIFSKQYINIRPENQFDRMVYVIYALSNHYTAKRINKCLTELFQIKVA